MTAVGTKDKSVDWFQPELEDVNAQARSVLETYSNIPSDQVVPHVLRIRDTAWEVFPYPCIGQFRFLDMPLGGFNEYPEILKRLKSGNEKYLDLGCCFGQDIRRLVNDGVPGSVLIGSDLHRGFLDLGYDLFKDKDNLDSKFIAADVFESQSALTPLEGKIDILHTSSFFHLFGYEGQKKIARRVVQLLKPQKDSLLVGRQVGNVRAHEEESSASGSGNMFLQNVESWKQMWEEIGEETGTQWDVNATLEDWPLVGNKVSWHKEGTKRIFFSVRRL
ncbi:hypothetical protein D6C86_08622 [Aureobasidium pullulans]|uniref:Methyltransferase domain-containing protein n=1 Tax=Aureobasidium pullulans TaxID=5580 RepID=A0A4S8YG28_AURPU|nr:hypothetical protein D6D22_01684 [Aureobasidium pullulans]THX31397.1 hypothetical protein D6D12_02875 [Aureobasidium pullulans]THX41093.1 hypothetical protein D6D10_02990 [Aureobasidium pullulans]THY61884.1 hypothetical protein D6C99_01096 [Aureobasidium pullulans]THY69496.1 hypothetical protein D6C94_09498 [Aureobasidium pullulans]